MYAITERLYVRGNTTDDAPIIDDMCDHTYAIYDFLGREHWRNGPCTCDLLVVGMVTRLYKHSPNTQAYTETVDDLPF